MSKEKKWYVLQVYPGTEIKVAESIKNKSKIVGLEDCFGELVVPTEEVVESKGGKRKKVQQRFLPGYVLANIAIDDQVLNFVRDVTGVFSFIGGTPSNPASMSQAEVDNILSKIKESSDSPKPKVVYEVGSVVKITEGPFVDFDATVEYVNYEKSIMKVSIAVFGRSTPVELSFDSVVSI